MVGDEKQFEEWWKKAKAVLRVKKSEYTVAEANKKKEAITKAAAQASLSSNSPAATMNAMTAMPASTASSITPSQQDLNSTLNNSDINDSVLTDQRENENLLISN